MVPRFASLVPSLLLVSTAFPAFAVDNTSAPAPSPTPVGSPGGQTPSVIGPNGGQIEVSPGKTQSANRLVYIQGLVDIDYLQLGRYTSANSSIPDHRSEEWIRAEVGARVEVDDRVEVSVALAYQGVSGTDTPTSPAGTAANNNSTSNGPSNGTAGNAVVNDAFVTLKEFLGSRNLMVEVGRMPVDWNLRKDHAAFLYDSHANNPTITSWDGIRARYNYDTLDFTPYVLRMPDNSSLFGAMVDWQPETTGNDRYFITGSANMERDIQLNTNDGFASVNATPVYGSKLYTYYVGADADLSDVELFGEFAMQRGTQDGNTSFGGYGVSGGVDWHLDTSMVFGIQGDFLSGDDSDNNAAGTPNATNHAFINKWSGTSDTLIVENPKYGRLANLVEGDLEALKIKFEYALDDHKRVRAKILYADYRLSKASASGTKDFGQEADLTLAWDYTSNATISLLAGGFKPGSAYDSVSLSPTPANDLVYLIAVNLLVKF
jgi:hypothetical protein